MYVWKSVLLALILRSNFFPSVKFLFWPLCTQLKAQCHPILHWLAITEKVLYHFWSFILSISRFFSPSLFRASSHQVVVVVVLLVAMRGVVVLQEQLLKTGSFFVASLWTLFQVNHLAFLFTCQCLCSQV